MPQKIITVTLNTAVDVAIAISHFTPNDVIDAESVNLTAGGKGINVARALAALDEPVIALGIIGQESRKIFSSVASSLIKTDFIEVSGSSRQNFTIIEKNTDATTHIRSKGFTVEPDAATMIKQKLNDYVDESDFVVFSGSLPDGLDESFYMELIQFCNSREAFSFLDSSGSALVRGSAAYPWMIKPNITEFNTSFGSFSGEDVEDILQRMNELNKNQIHYIAVSMGARGVLFTNGKQKFCGRINERIILPQRKPVGSGDAMLAGFVYAAKHLFDIDEMIRYGVACGTANLFATIPGQINTENFKGFLPQVMIEEL